MSRTFFCLRRRRGFSPRHPAPVTIEDAGLVSGPGVGFALFHLSRFIFSSSDERRSVSETGKHSWLYGVNHGSICDSRPSAFSGYPRGHRVNTEAQCHRHCAPTGDKDAHPRTRASQEPTGHHQKKDHWRWKGLFTRDAQAACDFSLSASKFSPFFHRVSVMAAILRASVRRAMVGLMPLASDLW